MLCEGDPFFYGSFMYLYERLADKFPCEVIPGVSSVMAGAAALGRPLAARNDRFAVVPAPLDDEEITAQIKASDAVAIIKIGRHFERLVALLDKLDLIEQARYLEYISLEKQRIMPLKDAQVSKAPYFSMILIYNGAEGWINDLPSIGGD